MQSKVLQWTQYAELLLSTAVDQPQAAYIALVQSLQSECLFLQRATPDCGNLFADIESALSTNFIPSLIGRECSCHEQLLYSHSISMGGLNINNHTPTASQSYSTLWSVVCQLTNSIKFCKPFNPVNHDLNTVQVIQVNIIVRKEHDNNFFSSVIGHFDQKHQRAILRSKNKSSSWPTALPVQRDNFNLSAYEFHSMAKLSFFCIH